MIVLVLTSEYVCALLPVHFVGTWVSGVRQTDMYTAIKFKDAQDEVKALLKGKTLGESESEK